MIHEYLASQPLSILGLRPGMVAPSVHEALKVAQKALDAVPADLYLDIQDLDIERYGEDENAQYHCMLMIRQKRSDTKSLSEGEEDGVLYLDVGEAGRIRTVSITMQSGVIGGLDWFPKILDTEFSAIRSRMGSPIAILDQVPDWVVSRNMEVGDPQVIRMDAYADVPPGPTQVFARASDFLAAIDEVAAQQAKPVMSISMGPIQDTEGKARAFAMAKLS